MAERCACGNKAPDGVMCRACWRAQSAAAAQDQAWQDDGP